MNVMGPLAALCGMVLVACSVGPKAADNHATPQPPLAVGERIHATLHEAWSATTVLSQQGSSSPNQTYQAGIDLKANLRIEVISVDESGWALKITMTSLHIASASAAGQLRAPAPWSIRIDRRGRIVAGHLWAEVGGQAPVDGLDFWSVGIPHEQASAGQAWTSAWSRRRAGSSALKYEGPSSITKSDARGLTAESTLPFTYDDLVNRDLDEHRSATVRSVVTTSIDTRGRLTRSVAASDFEVADSAQYSPERSQTTGKASLDLQLRYGG